MSWIRESSLNLLQLFAVKVLKSGKIPKHVAFIMDGNRRYAKKINAEKSVEGHVKGFDKLAEVLHWCLDLGISEVTMFAFSIENFKRTPEEVSDLMDLIRQKLKRLLEEKDKLAERGVRIRILGNLSLLPRDVVRMIAEAMEITRRNDKAFLNVALSYTSRDEMTRAIKDVTRGVKNGDLLGEDIDEDLISRSLDSGDSALPDLLIRTSSEVRLSDFLLWQSSSAYLHFADVLWPEFSIWDLLGAIFHYQRSYSALETLKNQRAKNGPTKTLYVEKLYEQRRQSLQKNAECL